MDLLALDEAGLRLLLRAVLVAVLLGICGGLLGCVLLARRISLLADALAHSLLPGIGVAWILWGMSWTAILLGGLGAGLATALCAGLLSRLTRLAEDAAYAGLLSAMLAVGVLLISWKGSPGDLQHLLFGQILAVGRADLVLAGIATLATVGAFTIGYRAILLECFDADFHRACGGRGALVHLGLLGLVVVVLVTALHSLGTLLALGLFTLPAVSASLWCERWHRMLVLSASLAAVGAVVGMGASLMTGAPSGACIVSCLGLAFAVSCLAAPNGLLQRGRHHHHEREDAADHCERSA